MTAKFANRRYIVQTWNDDRGWTSHYSFDGFDAAHSQAEVFRNLGYIAQIVDTLSL